MRTLITLSFLLLTADAHALPTAAEMGAELGLDEKAIAEVKAGKMVRLSPPEVSERDLSVGFVFWTQLSPQAIGEALRHSNDFAADPAIVSSHRIESLADLSSLHLSVNGEAESARYRGAEAGDALNLSSEELVALRKLAPSASQGEVETLVQRAIGARYIAYKRSGLAGIAPYARANGKTVRPGDELRFAIGALRLLDKYAPVFKALLLDYPSKKGPGFEESFYWILYSLDGRPTPVLRHRMTLPSGDGLLVSDREIYVSQGHNDSQAVAALLPTNGGTMVFYATHTSTDRVAGAAASAKHSIGRRMMGKQLEQIFERARKQSR